jgi:hypothetical protein
MTRVTARLPASARCGTRAVPSATVPTGPRGPVTSVR